MENAWQNITPVSKELKARLQAKIDNKTKPQKALGSLENLALKLGLIQNCEEINLNNPHLLVFAADHGIAEEGVSAYPQEVTHQMVQNFLNGGAAINIFARQHGLKLKIIDAGVKYDFQKSKHKDLIHAKIGHGTQNFLRYPAMTHEQCDKAIFQSSSLIKKIHDEGCNTIAFGEMGIGNTAAASMLMSKFCQFPLEACIGKGAGLDEKGFHKKLKILQQALAHHELPEKSTPIEVLTTFGGFEISMICGAMLEAATRGMVILVDGFISTVALLTAWKMNPLVLDYCIFTHLSAEKGHKALLDYLQVQPLLNLDLRLGEGTGAALAYPLLMSAQNFLNEMASFDSAGVSGKT